MVHHPEGPARHTGPTSPHDPADHGHHGHHILGSGLLLKVFGSLLVLTVLTVVLALMERSGALHFGSFSIVVALVIASAKALLVALYFMALKYDNRVNALAFSMGLLFLLVFLSITYLDTGFRGAFPGWSGTTVDVDVLEERRLQREAEGLPSEAQPLVLPADTLVINP